MYDFVHGRIKFITNHRFYTFVFVNIDKPNQIIGMSKFWIFTWYESCDLPSWLINNKTKTTQEAHHEVETETNHDELIKTETLRNTIMKKSKHTNIVKQNFCKIFSNSHRNDQITEVYIYAYQHNSTSICVTSRCIMYHGLTNLNKKWCLSYMWNI